MKAAEKRCRKLRVGMVEWSPEFGKAMDLHRYWVLVLLRHDGHAISARRLIRLASSLGIQAPFDLSREELVLKVFDGQEEYEFQKKKATSSRGK